MLSRAHLLRPHITRLRGTYTRGTYVTTTHQHTLIGDGNEVGCIHYNTAAAMANVATYNLVLDYKRLRPASVAGAKLLWP